MQLNRFDLIAPFYDSISSIIFGSAIKNSQRCFLDQVTSGSQVLVIGGGTGWWLSTFLKINPSVAICYIEASSKMLELARKNSGDDTRIDFIHGTESAVPRKKFDAIITFYLLDVFDEDALSKLIDDVGGHLKSGGRWIVADFVEEKIWHRMFLFFMYSFFRIIGALDTRRLPDWRRLFGRCGYGLSATRQFYFGFIRASIFLRG